MSFVIRGEATLDVDYLDIDRALCGECEKPLVWTPDKKADCCGFRYAYWTSTVQCHRVPLAAPRKRERAENIDCTRCQGTGLSGPSLGKCGSCGGRGYFLPKEPS